MSRAVSHLIPLAARSAWNRRATLALTVLAIALSVCLLLGVERLRLALREGFAQTISGADLIVGARGSALQLMLYSVFHLGDAPAGLNWASAQAIARHPAVAWRIPLALGDSHRGYPVVGTTPACFAHWRHGDGQPLRMAQGRAWNEDDLFSAVMGAEVAEALGYGLGSRVALTHGEGGHEGASSGHDDVHDDHDAHDDHAHDAHDAHDHADKPFTVVGILARTGTPVDRSVLVSLASMEALHLDWQGGVRMSGMAIPAEYVRRFDLTPKRIDALVIGLKSRAAVFMLQRHVDAYRDEALMAVLPGVALAELWQMAGVGESALLAVSALVVAVGLAGLVAVVLAGLNERRRELAILRAVGARPADIFMLLSLEGLGLTLAGAVLGLALLTALGLAAGPWIAAHYGLSLNATLPTASEGILLAAVVGVGLLASLVPGWRAYRLSLADGLTPRT